VMRIRRVLLVGCTLALILNFKISLAQQPTIINDISYPYLEKLVSIAKENYPRVKYFEGRRNAGKININYQKLSWFDSFSFSYVYRPSNTVDIVNPSIFNGYQAGLTLNFGSLLQIPGNVKKAKEEYKALDGEYKEYLILLESEVKKRYFEYLKFKKNLEVQTRIILDVESIEKQQKILYEKSEISLKEYNESLVVLSNHTTTKIGLEEDLLSSKVALEELLGKKLEDIQ
jgi:outer membrane protein TolC